MEIKRLQKQNIRTGEDEAGKYQWKNRSYEKSWYEKLIWKNLQKKNKDMEIEWECKSKVMEE